MQEGCTMSAVVVILLFTYQTAAFICVCLLCVPTERTINIQNKHSHIHNSLRALVCTLGGAGAAN